MPYHWGRYRGLALDMKRPPLEEHLLKNVFFDTCVYHLPGIELLTKVVPIENILFASEMVGAVKGIDPNTGHHFDDTKRYVDQLKLSEADRTRIFEGNARRVFGRLDARSQEAAQGRRHSEGRRDREETMSELPRLNGIIRALEQGQPAFTVLLPGGGRFRARHERLEIRRRRVRDGAQPLGRARAAGVAAVPAEPAPARASRARSRRR